MPSLGEKLIPFYKLLRKQVDFEITEDHHKNLETLKSDPSQDCSMSYSAMPATTGLDLC